MINHKRTERLYREENLMLRVRRRKKVASESRVAPPTPERRNHCWAMDFMSDNLYNGRRFRVLNVLDSYRAGIISVMKSAHQSTVNEYAAYWKGLPGSKVCRK